MKKGSKTPSKAAASLVPILVLAAGAIGMILIMLATGPTQVPNGATLELVSPAAYQADFEPGEHILLDVRTPEEFASGHIEGAINIPVEELAQRVAEVPTGQPVVVYCRTGNRSSSAARILANAGFNTVYDIQGGTVNWAREGLPLQ